MDQLVGVLAVALSHLVRKHFSLTSDQHGLNYDAQGFGENTHAHLKTENAFNIQLALSQKYVQVLP